MLSDSHSHQPGLDYARDLDRRDPLRHTRDLFEFPRSPAHADGRPALYLCGNSLGLLPRASRAAVVSELDAWSTFGVEGHFHAPHPWAPYHEELRQSAASLVGARTHEVVVMNSLTVNLHMLMVSFFQPRAERRKIAIDFPCFPSDVYAVKSQLRFHGLDPDRDLLRLDPRPGEHTLRTEDIEAALKREGHTVALVLLAGVNFATGQHHDIARITRAAHDAGCVMGVDLAHAAGNVPLSLHDWNVDFAAWCSYKYLNSGPGAVAGAFVHERHTSAADHASRPRFEGWWGNDPATRFRMGEQFTPVASADAWQVSNPPILAMAPVRESLAIFHKVGMPALRDKSRRLTGYLEWLLDELRARRPQSFEIITPRNPASRGCQLSILVNDRAREVQKSLLSRGVMCDFREPNIIRVAPTPLYNTFEDCHHFAGHLEAALG